jgi:hypothetical protein
MKWRTIDFLAVKSRLDVSMQLGDSILRRVISSNDMKVCAIAQLTDLELLKLGGITSNADHNRTSLQKGVSSSLADEARGAKNDSNLSRKRRRHGTIEDIEMISDEVSRLLNEESESNPVLWAQGAAPEKIEGSLRGGGWRVEGSRFLYGANDALICD